jgi:phosphoribosylamine-glycine ligase
VVIISPFSPWFEILGLENMSATDKALAEAIAENMMEHIMQIKTGAQRMNVPLISVGPEEMLDAVLTEYLQAKKKGKAY